MLSLAARGRRTTRTDLHLRLVRRRMTTTTPPSTLKPIRSAAILIIGDEILNGKILDTNSYHFARFCFNNLAIPLKRTIVCGDDELDIKNSLDVLLKQDKVDFVVTSGGLGSTHDDITYQVLASYFNLDYKLDEEVVKKMHSLRDGYLSTLSKDQLGAFYRMATLPVASKDSPISTKNLFFDEKLWFPILEIDQSVYVLPGVPQLFTQLLNDMEPFLKRRVAPTNLSRRYVVTKTGETQLAPYLTRLQQDCIAKHGEGVVKLGSYPHMDSKVNTISIIGKDLENPSVLNGIVGDLIENVGGDAKEISQEEEDKLR